MFDYLGYRSISHTRVRKCDTHKPENFLLVSDARSHRDHPFRGNLAGRWVIELRNCIHSLYLLNLCIRQCIAHYLSIIRLILLGNRTQHSRYRKHDTRHSGWV